MIIRPAVLIDLDQIFHIEQICSQNPWSYAGLFEELSNSNALFFVLEKTAMQPDDPKKQIIGFVCSAMVLDEIHIYEVAVHPNYRRNGLGMLLMNRLLSEAAAQNITRICLEARVSNHSAIKLYEKCGFMRDGIRKKYYQDGEDAVLMSLRG